MADNPTNKAGNAKKCAHPSCDCTVTDTKYCSAYCEGAKDTVEIGCGCGHPACR